MDPIRASVPAQPQSEESMPDQDAKDAARLPHDAAEGASPFQIAHHIQAGLHLYKFPRFKQMQLRFDNDVPPAIADLLHTTGWQYRANEGVYTKQFGHQGQAAAIIEARRLYGELCKKLVPE